MADEIEKLLCAAIQTKVIEAFNTTPEMVEKMVAAAFTKDVDPATGAPPSRHSYSRGTMPWIDWLVGNEIRNAAQDAVKEYMAAHRDEVKSKVVAAIQAGQFGEKIGELVASMMDDEYRWNFTVERRERD